MQTAHKLTGSGLLPWSGNVRRSFETQYGELLTRLRISSSSLTYVGSVVSATFGLLKPLAQFQSGTRTPTSVAVQLET